MRLDDEQSRRLAGASNIWLASVRAPGADGLARPHLVPLWFVWLPEEQRLYFCTPAASVKARNIAHNAHVALALEDGSRPLILEGVAERLDGLHAPAAAAFEAKYAWTITPGDADATLYAVTPRKLIAWAAG